MRQEIFALCEIKAKAVWGGIKVLRVNNENLSQFKSQFIIRNKTPRSCIKIKDFTWSFISLISIKQPI